VNALGDVQIPSLREPRLFACPCGKEYLEVWYDLNQRRDDCRPVGGLRGPGFWCAPRIDPCPHCETDATLEFERELRYRLSKASVPKAYHGFTLDSGAFLTQVTGEDDATFQQRCKRESKFGAYKANVSALRYVRDEWLAKDSNGALLRPGRLPTRWLILHGPSGTGKTAILGAIARTLLAGPLRHGLAGRRKPGETLSRVDMPKRMLTIPHEQRNGESVEAWTTRMEQADAAGLLSALVPWRLPEVQYDEANDLFDRHAVRFRGEMNFEARDAAMAQVLMLDEFGMRPKINDAEMEFVRGLVVQRHNRNRLTIIATNRGWDELTKRGESLYGDAVADRLRTAAQVHLGGPSWR
jgi:DNA replication protein DnaC